MRHFIMYITTVDNFQQENNWKVYTCDDGTIISYFPGEPAHIEIGDGDCAGFYEEGGDKVNQLSIIAENGDEFLGYSCEPA